MFSVFVGVQPNAALGERHLIGSAMQRFGIGK
jgi:hypothetical protein